MRILHFALFIAIFGACKSLTPIQKATVPEKDNGSEDGVSSSGPLGGDKQETEGEIDPEEYSTLGADGISLVDSATADLKTQVGTIFLQSCGKCHNKSGPTPVYVDNNKVQWDTVIKTSSSILARVNAKTNPMPSLDAPAALQITAKQKATITSYLKTQTSFKPKISLDKLKLPPRFSIKVFAPVLGARTMAVHSSGVVFVGTGGFWNKDPEGRVLALVPQGGQIKVVSFLKGLDNPNGVALDGDDLYVVEYQRIVRISNARQLAQKMAKEGGGPVDKAKYKTIFKNFPKQNVHQWKSIAISPDRKIYVSVGSNCNSCDFDRNIFSVILRMNLDGSGQSVVARGVRNTMGLAFHPNTKKLWFTDNSRDEMGPDIPNDELNVLNGGRNDFGFPFCHGKGTKDPLFNAGKDCNSFKSPFVALDAHVAPLGLSFYTGNVFPQEYRNQIFIAEHGATGLPKIGYRIKMVNPESGSGTYKDFISGWLGKGTDKFWGRPVDVKNYIDNSLLISDDYAGVVYQVSYK